MGHHLLLSIAMLSPPSQRARRSTAPSAAGSGPARSVTWATSARAGTWAIWHLAQIARARMGTLRLRIPWYLHYLCIYVLF